jgi:hypothetical protein
VTVEICPFEEGIVVGRVPAGYMDAICVAGGLLDEFVEVLAALPLPISSPHPDKMHVVEATTNETAIR